MLKLSQALLCAATLFAAGLAQAADPIVIKFAHVVAENTPKGQGTLLFKSSPRNACRAGSGSRCTRTHRCLAMAKKMEALLLGDVQMLAPSLAKFEQYTKQVQIYDLPFLFNDLAAVDRFRAAQGEDLLTSMRNKSIAKLACWRNGLGNSRRQGA